MKTFWLAAACCQKSRRRWLLCPGRLSHKVCKCTAKLKQDGCRWHATRWREQGPNLIVEGSMLCVGELTDCGMGQKVSGELGSKRLLVNLRLSELVHRQIKGWMCHCCWYIGCWNSGSVMLWALLCWLKAVFFCNFAFVEVNWCGGFGYSVESSGGCMARSMMAVVSFCITRLLLLNLAYLEDQILQTAEEQWWRFERHCLAEYSHGLERNEAMLQSVVGSQCVELPMISKMI